jgi:hypothetical protein
MKLVNIAATISLLIMLGSCASVKVDQINSAQLNNYKKYAWVSPDIEVDHNPLYSSSMTDTNIKSAIRTELAKKGVSEDSQNPDFLLMYHIYTTQKSQSVPNASPMMSPFGYGFGPTAFLFRGMIVPIGYSGYYNPWNSGYHTVQYTEGTLIIDVLDAKSHELVWRGSIANPVNDPAHLGKQFSKESREILAKYPPFKS